MVACAARLLLVMSNAISGLWCEMKVDSNDIGTFEGTMTTAEGNAWLTCKSDDLSLLANGAIDEAVSFANQHGFAFVVIKIIGDN